MEINNLLMVVIYKGDETIKDNTVGYTPEQKKIIENKMKESREELNRFLSASVETLGYKLESDGACDLFDLLMNQEPMRVMPKPDADLYEKIKHIITYYTAVFDAVIKSKMYDSYCKTSTRLYTCPVVLPIELYNMVKRLTINPNSKEYQDFAKYFYAKKNPNFDLTVFVSNN